MHKKPSAGNPCPFLRALEAQSIVAADAEPLPRISQLVEKASGTKGAEAAGIRRATYAIAMVANGLTPLQIFRNIRAGVRINQLRNGPFDKKGSGSRILNAQAEVVTSELNRLDEFAIDVRENETGFTERGLILEKLKEMMDANFARAKDSRRMIDRRLMDGEWPVLLRMMGKDSDKGRYLSVMEVRALFVEHQLPNRILDRVAPSH